MVELSVIIPSYRARETIAQCLQAVMDQSLSQGLYEVIVVDSSDDGTDEMIKTSFPEVRLIHLSEKALPGEARNIGIRGSVGRLIAFIDTDCIAGHNLLEGMVESLKVHELAGVGGAIANGNPKSLSGWVEYLINFNNFTPEKPLHFPSHIPTCNLCLRREIFERFGPFPEDHFPGEDRVFNWRVKKGKERLLFDPSLFVRHLNRTGFKKVFQHQLKYGQAFAITRSRFPLPGRFFVVFPLFSFFIPFARWGLILFKFRWNPRLLGMTILLAPFIWVALMVWTHGFWSQLRELRDQERKDQPLLGKRWGMRI